MGKKKFLAIGILMLTGVAVEAQNGGEAVAIWNPTLPIRNSQAHKVQNAIRTTTSYNSASTALTVKFPATGGGKVEIYRNGAKVVSANAAAGATLCYTLRNYGRGNYTVIISGRNTVVYCRSMNVK